MAKRKKEKIVLIDEENIGVVKVEKSVALCITENKIEAVKTLADHDWSGLGSHQAFVSNEVIKPLKYFEDNFRKPKTLDDYKAAYYGFMNIIKAVNEYIVYNPTLTGFCKYIFTSRNYFVERASHKDDIGIFLSQVRDYLSETLMQNMMSGNTSPIPSIFVAKADYGMRDNEVTTQNVINVQGASRDLETILKEIEKLNG